MFTLNCKGKLINFQKPLVMGIVNITSDSFYKGYLGEDERKLMQVVKKMIADGATIIDIGGQTTKPGSIPIAAEVEAQRVIPVIKKILALFPDCIISIDTYYSTVAKAAVEAGAAIVNDISAGDLDPEMISLVGAMQVPYVCMHMKGTPATMQKEPFYNDVVKEVLEFFIEKIDACTKAGITDIIIDPGFGFGKTIAHNFQLLKALNLFKILEKPLLAGISRKGMVYKPLGISAGEALNGTAVLNTIALQNGAAILRVHDVREAVEQVTLMDIYENSA